MDASAEYRKRLAQRQALCDNCLKNMNRIGAVRLALFLCFLGMLWIAFGLRAMSGWVSLIPVTLFIGVVMYHDRLHRAHDRAKRAVAFYERNLDRLENRWQGKGISGSDYLTDGHLYAVDLDILGSASLFELLCTARTRAGEETLARWLCNPASRTEILRRQQAVGELRNNLDLREDLAMIGSEIRNEVHPEFMIAWANRPLRLFSPAARIALAALVVVMIGAAVYSVFPGGSTVPLYAVLVIEAVVGLALRSRVQEVLRTLDEPVHELRVLGAALRRVEQEDYSSQKLRALQENLSKGERRPSDEIARLLTLIHYLHQRKNQFFAPFSASLMWATQFTFAIEAWRRRCGPEIGSWLQNFGEFEALCSIAGYAYDHPAEPFPEIVEGSTLFEGEELCHPLIPAAACVPNSVNLGGDLQLLLISGSNMSGKSTLLRTVGINTVLALAGGPVRAKRMKLCVLNIGATLRVQDSLQAGVSRFYAEIQRLHDTMELCSGPLPVLFLLDEILHGTNSHDRAIGAEAIVRGLIERGAIGLVTTHDLALTRVAESMPRARNAHFQDNLQNGRMTFDYVLHPGVVERSNALELMRAVGLKV